MENTSDGEERVYHRLRLYDEVMAGMHLLQGLLMVALRNDFSLSVTTNYLEAKPAQFNQPSLPEVAGHLRIGPMMAAFLFMGALAHLLLTLPGIYEWYVRNFNRASTTPGG